MPIPASCSGNTGSTCFRATSRRTVSRWASPAADPETGNVYVFGVGARCSRSPKTASSCGSARVGRRIPLFTTHGGRTMSPIIDGDLVIVTAAVSTWGTQATASAPFHRARQADRRDRVCVESGRPPATTRRTQLRTSRRSTERRLLIAGLGDGGIHAIKPQTGEKVWSYDRRKARHQHGRGGERQHGDRLAQRGESGRQRDGHDRRASTRRRRGKHRDQVGRNGRTAGSSANSRRRSWMATVYLRLITARICTPSIHERAPAMETESGHRAEGIARFGRRQALRGNRERKVLIIRPHADRCRNPERSGAAPQPAGTGQSKKCRNRCSPPRQSREAVFISFRANAVRNRPRRRNNVTARLRRILTGRPVRAARPGCRCADRGCPRTAGQTVKLPRAPLRCTRRFLREEKATWSLEGLKGSSTTAD